MTDEPTSARQDIHQQAHASSGGFVVQGGRDATLHVHGAPPRASLPYRAGRVPPRAEGFQAREITGAFAAGDALAPVTVLSGLGGVGKTQLAADHAERAWASADVDLLVWVTASSTEAVVDEYARVAEALTGIKEVDRRHGADSLLNWLATTSGPNPDCTRR